jgi:hypothetical protein
MAQSFGAWQQTDPTPAATGAASGPDPYFRSAYDKQLSGWKVTPEAAYPDGYLGDTEASRRSQRLEAAGGRATQKSYQRGVHKGERIDAADYAWPREFNMWSGLEAEARGEKFVSVGQAPITLTNDGKVGPRGIDRDPRTPEVRAEIQAQRRAQLARLKPHWK